LRRLFLLAMRCWHRGWPESSGVCTRMCCLGLHIGAHPSRNLPQCADTTRQKRAPRLKRLALQGNCSAVVPLRTSIPVATWPLQPGQCAIGVREDFLQVGGVRLAHLWVDHLYVYIDPSWSKTHIREDSTLVGIQKGDFYVTRSAFVGDGDKCRAVDINAGRKMYARGVLSLSTSSVPCCSRYQDDTAVAALINLQKQLPQQIMLCWVYQLTLPPCF
jgi:hypothetical protein